MALACLVEACSSAPACLTPAWLAAHMACSGAGCSGTLSGGQAHMACGLGRRLKQSQAGEADTLPSEIALVDLQDRFNRQPGRWAD